MLTLRARGVAHDRAVPAVVGPAGSSATPPWPISALARLRGAEAGR